MSLSKRKRFINFLSTCCDPHIGGTDLPPHYNVEPVEMACFACGLKDNEAMGELLVVCRGGHVAHSRCHAQLKRDIKINCPRPGCGRIIFTWGQGIRK